MQKIKDVVASIVGVMLAVAVSYAILAGLFWVVWRIWYLASAKFGGFRVPFFTSKKTPPSRRTRRGKGLHNYKLRQTNHTFPSI